MPDVFIRDFLFRRLNVIFCFLILYAKFNFVPQAVDILVKTAADEKITLRNIHAVDAHKNIARGEVFHENTLRLVDVKPWCLRFILAASCDKKNCNKQAIRQNVRSKRHVVILSL